MQDRPGQPPPLGEDPQFACPGLCLIMQKGVPKVVGPRSFHVGRLDVRTIYRTGAAGVVLRSLRGQPARKHLDRDRAPASGIDPRRQGADGAGSFARSHLLLENIRKEIEGRTVFREKVSTSVEIPFSTETKRVLQYCGRRGRPPAPQLHRGPSTSCSGILREERSVAASILTERGMRLNTAREDIVQLLNEKTVLTRVKETPLLAEFSRDLTESAMKNQLDPLVGRDSELERVEQVLCRRTKNNAVLIGEPGVGKTAIVEGLAQKIVFGDVPHFLADKRILALDISLIVAGTKYRWPVRRASQGDHEGID